MKVKARAGGTVVIASAAVAVIMGSTAGALRTDRRDPVHTARATHSPVLPDDGSLFRDGVANRGTSTLSVSVTVDGKASVHPISPYIYGVAGAGAAFVKANHLTLERWGGNPTSRYNWRLGAGMNTASDWYFENTDYGNSCASPGCAVDQMVSGDRAARAASLVTLPTLGWVARDRSLDTCGFPVSKYGPQQQTDPYRPNCGNGLTPSGGPITGNEPADTSVRSTPADIQAFVRSLVVRFGSAAKGGVKFFAMDNEPELWSYTHRDVHPQPLTYQGLYDEFENYASAVKKIDPTAMIDGPVPWGWSAYFDSTFDYANNTQSDRQAHGGLPIIPWFLKSVRAHDQSTGVRSLNVLDIHYYPQAKGVFSDASDPATNALRLRATRSLWDPTYTDESWIGDKVDLIRRMKEWIARYYPGTKLGVSEWNFGGERVMSGALAIANVLGIFGREGVYLASYWTHPGSASPGAKAFDLYRNYDGKGGSFGNVSIGTVSDRPGSLMAFGSVRTRDHRVMIMLVNQKPGAGAVVKLTLRHLSVSGRAQVYRFGPASAAIQHLASVRASPAMTVTVAPYSVELLVVRS